MNSVGVDDWTAEWTIIASNVNRNSTMRSISLHLVLLEDAHRQFLDGNLIALM